MVCLESTFLLAALFSLSLRASAVAIAWQSIHSALVKKALLESAFADLWIATTSLWKSRDDNRGLAWRKARDDRNGESVCDDREMVDLSKVDSRLKSLAVGFVISVPLLDSKILGLESTFGNAKNVSEQPKDSRICDEKPGFIVAILISQGLQLRHLGRFE